MPTPPASPAPPPARNALHPKKLALSKWTAVEPVAKEKHFLVTRVAEPDEAGVVAWVDVEAVLTRAVRRIEWRELADGARWRRGWV